ncbi:hypothetical protein SASPL_101091 [Salvia splendens]|uniref:Palmitoyltransferase n=1 Tax=Salvia splendens TaxID=180675 RepID=A0A8X8YPG3_SALSN|nr:hypothetical protein SASPL_101091 [Salvia splendens]
MRFDHHCPAFENCIVNEIMLVLIIGFVIFETSFVLCASLSYYIQKFGCWYSIILLYLSALAGNPPLLGCASTVVVFIMWHVYCACFNIKTDGWVSSIIILEQID